MKLKQYQIDAFSDRVFCGNPAAVVPLPKWLDDTQLQAIAEENNLSETAFFVADENGYELRWFTPSQEVKLCGHATLASAYVLYEMLGYTGSQIRFRTLSGDLVVERDGDFFAMDFPAQVPADCDSDTVEVLSQALGACPRSVLAAQYYLAVFDNEADIVAITPNFEALARLDKAVIIVTAPAATTPAPGAPVVDFVSRVFAPNVGIPEDPVTGSAHCELAPYWANVFGKTELKARQISKRGGYVECRVYGGRVTLRGRAALFSKSEIYL